MAIIKKSKRIERRPSKVRKSLFDTILKYIDSDGGTKRRTLDGKWTNVIEGGVCDCGWSKKNSSMCEAVEPLSNRCKECLISDFSICNGQEIHKCKNCDDYVDG